MDGVFRKIVDRSFLIRIDVSNRLVDVALIGFWTQDDLRRFRTVLGDVPPMLSAGGCPPGAHASLFDLSGFDVQAQDVLAGLSTMVGEAVLGSRRIAIVLSSALLRMQSRRIAPNYRQFETRSEALAWLAEP